MDKIQIIKFIGWNIIGNIVTTPDGDLFELDNISFITDPKFQNAAIEHIENMGYCFNTYSTYLSKQEKPIYYTTIDTKFGVEIVSTEFNSSRLYSTYEGISEFIKQII